MVFQRFPEMFPLFPYYRKSFKRILKTTLDVTLGRFLEIFGNNGNLSVSPCYLTTYQFRKWKQFGNIEDQMETSDLPSDADTTNAAIAMNCPTELRYVKS